MRTQNRKKIQIEPIKSPSPDVANRNVIRDTIAPIEQIEKYQQSRSRSRSPRISHSLIFNQPTNQIQKCRAQICYLREQLQYLENKQAENHQLIENNTMLAQQIAYLKNQMDRVKKSYIENTRIYSYEPNHSNENQNILKEFNQRLMRLSEENKRISKKLQDQNAKADYLNKQNDMLKNQINFYKKQPKLNTSTNLPKQKLDDAYKQLDESADQRQKALENTINAKINDLQRKIDKIKVLQNILEERLQRQKIVSARTNIESTPIKNDSIATSWRPKYDTIPDVESENDSPMRMMKTRDFDQKLKSQNIRLTQKVEMLSRQNDYLRQCCGERQHQINNLELKIKQFKEKQISMGFSTENSSNSLIPKKQQDSNTFSESQLGFMRQKIKNLQSDIKNKLNSIANLQQQCNLKDRQCNLVKKRLEDANNFLQNQMPNFQKVIDQQRLKNQKLQEQIAILNNKLNAQNQKNNEILQLKQQISKLPKLLNDMRCLQEQMDKRNTTLSYALREYLEFIQQIKITLTGSKIEKVLSETYDLEQSFFAMEKIKTESANLIIQLRKKLLQKEDTILELQKTNAVLKSELQQTKKHQAKLKELIRQYSSSSSVKKSGVQSTLQIHQRSKINCNLKQVIKDAMSGLNKLQSQVNSQLTKINQIIQK